MNNRRILPVKSDIVFRMFFADERNLDLLTSFLKSVIKLPGDEFDKIEIADPFLSPEYIGDKYAIIDVKLYTKSRKIIHIEIQLLSEISDNNCNLIKYIIRVIFIKSIGIRT